MEPKMSLSLSSEGVRGIGIEISPSSGRVKRGDGVSCFVRGLM